LFICFEFVFCIVYVKKKQKKEKKKENIVKVYVWFVCFYGCFFYDEIVKNKEEFNILICSRIKNYELIRKSHF
jgi:hypothetical protein